MLSWKKLYHFAVGKEPSLTSFNKNYRANFFGEKKKERKKKSTLKLSGVYMFWEYAKKIKLNLFHVAFLVLESKGLFCLQRYGWEEPVPSFRVVKTTQKQAKRKYISRYLWKTGDVQF